MSRVFWPELGNGSISYLMLDWERERVSGEGMRIKSFILAIISIRCPLDVEVEIRSRQLVIQIWSPGGGVTARDINFEIINTSAASKPWDSMNITVISPLT